MKWCRETFQLSHFTPEEALNPDYWQNKPKTKVHRFTGHDSGSGIAVEQPRDVEGVEVLGP